MQGFSCNKHACNFQFTLHNKYNTAEKRSFFYAQLCHLVTTTQNTNHPFSKSCVGFVEVMWSFLTEYPHVHVKTAGMSEPPLHGQVLTGEEARQQSKPSDLLGNVNYSTNSAWKPLSWKATVKTARKPCSHKNVTNVPLLNGCFPSLFDPK